MTIIRRGDGRIEWLCEHGIGHTIWYPEGNDGLHGCDGCCGHKNTGKMANDFETWMRQNPWFKIDMGTTFVGKKE